jgi:hypothetical protein
MFVAEKFISNLIKIHSKHAISTTDGGTWYPHQACKFETKTSHPFISRAKHHRKDNAVYQGQDQRMF